MARNGPSSSFLIPIGKRFNHPLPSLPSGKPLNDFLFLKPSLIVVGVLNASRLEGNLRRHQLFLFELWVAYSSLVSALYSSELLLPLRLSTLRILHRSRIDEYSHLTPGLYALAIDLQHVKDSIFDVCINRSLCL